MWFAIYQARTLSISKLNIYLFNPNRFGFQDTYSQKDKYQYCRQSKFFSVLIHWKKLDWKEVAHLYNYDKRSSE